MGYKWEESCNYTLHQKWIEELKEQGCSSKWIDHFTTLCKHRFELKHLESAKEAILKLNKKKDLTKIIKHVIIKPSNKERKIKND